MQLTLTHQLSVFIWSCFFGVCLGALYILFRVFRLIVKHNRFFVFAEDFLFMALSGILTFLFCIGFNRGEVRFYIILGTFIGALLFVNTLGKIVIIAITFVLKFLKRVLSIVFKLFKPLIQKLQKKCHKKIKKVSKIKKMYLQVWYYIVYNLFGRFSRSNKLVRRKKLSYEGNKRTTKAKKA